MNLSNENVIHIKENGVEYLQFKRLLEYKDILTHGYIIGKEVNFRTAKINKKPLEKENYEKAIKDYQNVCKELGTDYRNLVKTNQEHTDEVKIVKGKINKDEPDLNLEQYYGTDGLITNKRNIMLSTTNADCILLLFFDPTKKVIANTHSGWRGTLQRISVKTINKMKQEYNCNPEDIICCICPSIRKCHFEVDEDVKLLFSKEFTDLEKLDEIIEKRETEGKWNIDTIMINKIILEREGLKAENIIDSKICSVCNSDYMHSYRVEKERYGLNTAIIELK